MKKILGWKPSKIIIAVILGVILLMAVIPLIRLAVYAIPWFDDYSYTINNRSFRAAYGDTLLNAIKGVLYQVKTSWYAWQGTYSSIFLMGMAPIAWGEQYYRIGCMALIIFFSLATPVMVYVLSTRMFGLKRSSSWCIAILTTILAIEKMYFPGHGFYWYNGGLHYIGMHSFLMLMIAVIVCFSDVKKTGAAVTQIILSTVLAFVVGGSNYVTVLQGAIVLAALVLYTGFRYGYGRSLRLIPTVVVYGIGFYFNASAPGNSVRAAYFADSSMNPLEAILYSFPEGAKMLGKFSDVFLLVTLAVLIPIIWDGLSVSRGKFSFPLIFILFMAGLYFACYTPGMYAGGKVDLAMVWNICKFTYQIALIFGEIYFIGWLHRTVKDHKWRLNLDIGYWWYYAACAAVVLALFFASNMERYDYSSYAAFYDVHSGESAALYGEYERRIEQIREQGSDVYVTAYTYRPWYLRQKDLSDNPDAEENKAMAEWYGKNSITLITK